MIKRFCIVLLTILLYFVSLSAQKVSPAKDSLRSDAPKIYLSDDFIGWDHFPACTKDHKNILIIHYDYSCCISNQTDLLMLNTKNTEITLSQILIPSETSPAFSIEENMKIVAKVDSILYKQDYYAMIPVDSFSIEKDSRTAQNYFKIRYNQQIMKSTEFVLPSCKFSGYCCTAIPEDTVKCEKTPDTYYVWLEKDGNFLLIAYGYTQGADGCEAGPFYMILKIKKKKSEKE